MKQSTTDYKQMFRERKVTLSLFGISVRSDWMLLLGISALLFVGLLFMSWQIYTDVSDDSYFDNEQQVRRTRGVNQEQLDRVVERFRMQEERFMELAGVGALRDGSVVVEQMQLLQEAGEGEGDDVTVATTTVDFDQSDED